MENVVERVGTSGTLASLNVCVCNGSQSCVCVNKLSTDHNDDNGKKIVHWSLDKQTKGFQQQPKNSSINR